MAENSTKALRFSKPQMNKAQDRMWYNSALEDARGDYVAMMDTPGANRVEGQRRLASVDLAVRGLKGDRYGLKKSDD